MTLASLVVKLSVDAADFHRDMEAIASRAEKTARQIEKAGREMAAAFSLPLLGAGLAAFHAALEESRQTGGALAASWDTLTSAAHSLGQQVGQALLPLFQQLVALLTSVVGVLSQAVAWFEHLSPATQAIIEKILLFAAVLGPALIALGKLIEAGAGVVHVLGLITAPVGVAIAAIAALAAWAYIFINDWAVVKEQFYLLWTAMKEAVLESVQFILDALTKLTGWIPTLGAKIKEADEAFRVWADGSLAKSAVTIQGLEHDIATAGATVQTHTVTIGRFQAAMDAMAASLRQASVQAALQGPSFNLAAAQAQIYQQTVQSLISQGAQLGDMLDHQGHTLRGLEAAFKSLTVSGTMAELNKTLIGNAAATEVVGASFHRARADAAAYRQAIDTLVAAGIPLNQSLGTTGTTLAQLRDRFTQSTATAAFAELAQGMQAVAAQASAEGESFDVARAQATQLDTAIKQLEAAGYGAANATFLQKMALAALKQEYKELITIGPLVNSVSAAIRTGFVDSISAIGQAIGGAGGDLGASVGKLFSGLLITVGKAMVTFGLAMIPLQKLLKNVFGTNPVAAIAAGAGLIALGTALGGAVQGAANTAVATGGSVGGGGGGSSSPSAPSAYSATQDTGQVIVKFPDGPQIFDPSDPRQVERFREFFANLTGRDVIIQTS